jgi:hypothetical protein
VVEEVLMQVQAPIIVAEGIDIRFFRSVEEAQRAIEPADLADGTIRAWDATGQTLIPVTRQSQAPEGRIMSALFPSWESVVLEAEGANSRPDELRSLLTKFLISCDANRCSYLVSEPPSLAELVRKAQARS